MESDANKNNNKENNNIEQEQATSSDNNNNDQSTDLMDSTDNTQRLQDNSLQNIQKSSYVTGNQNLTSISPMTSSSLSLHRSCNLTPTSVTGTCQPQPMSSCYLSSTSLNMPKGYIKLPTLLQLCIAQLNKSSISLSAITKMYATPKQIGSCAHLTFKPAGLSTPDSLISAPPSYSFVLRQMDMRRRPRLVGTFIPSPSFVLQTPPPAYATAFDIYVDSPIPPPPRSYNFGFTSMPVVCPECGFSGMTLVTSRATICTHICAATLCIFCCWVCAPLPYILRSCKNVYHYCRNCRNFLVMYCPTNPENMY